MYVLVVQLAAMKNTSSAVSEAWPLSEWFIHSYSELSIVAFTFHGRLIVHMILKYC